MDAAGFQEVHFPALLPREPYEASNRWTEYGDNLFRLKDRHGNDFLLAPTHEEMFTLLVKGLYSSYRDLPLSHLPDPDQVPRRGPARAGLLRGREFVMKDSYSFDVDDAGLQRSYERHREAYIKLFDRLGPAVRDRVGDVGGDGRLGVRGVPRPDRRRRRHVRALHQVRLRRQHRGGAHPGPDPIPFDGLPAAPWRTPPTRRRSQTLVDHLNAHPEFSAPNGGLDGRRHDEERGRQAAPPRRHVEPLAIGVPGDREVDLKRLEAQVGPAEVLPFDEADFAANPALVKGYIGPGALGSRARPASASSSTRGSSTARRGSPAPTSRAAT